MTILPRVARIEQFAKSFLEAGDVPVGKPEVFAPADLICEISDFVKPEFEEISAQVIVETGDGADDLGNVVNRRAEENARGRMVIVQVRYEYRVDDHRYRTQGRDTGNGKDRIAFEILVSRQHR